MLPTPLRKPRHRRTSSFLAEPNDLHAREVKDSLSVYFHKFLIQRSER
jgi:hypothetical protein